MKVKGKQALYDMAVVIMMIYEMIVKQSSFKLIYDLNMLGNLLWGMIIGLLLLKMLITRYSLRDMIVIVGIVVIFGISWMKVGEVTLLKFMFFTIASKDVELEKTLRCFVISMLVLCVVVVGASLIGILPKTISVIRNGRARYVFGFVAPSAVGFYAFNLSYVLFRNYKRIAGIKFVVFNVFALFVLWYFVNCRTAVIAIVFLWLCRIISIYHKNLFLNKIFVLTPVALAAGSLYFTVSYNASSKLHTLLDSSLSMRISSQNICYRYMGIHLFGSKNIMHDMTGLYLDNSYMALLLLFGIMALSLILVLYTIALKRAIEERESNTVIGIIVILFYGISELVLFNYSLNIVLFIVMDLVNRKKTGKADKGFTETSGIALI